MCFRWVRSTLFAQQPQAPAIPDDVIWEPAIQYATAGAKTVNLMMDVVRLAKAEWTVAGSGLHSWRRFSARIAGTAICRCASGLLSEVTWRLRSVIDFRPSISFPRRCMMSRRPFGGCGLMRLVSASILNASASRADPQVGHLALFLGLTAGIAEFEGSGPHPEQSSRVACVVNYYGPTDFTKSYGKSVDAAEVLPLFLGGDLEHERLAHIKASPLNWVSPSAAPVLTIHGTEDKYVAYEQAVWLN